MFHLIVLGWLLAALVMLAMWFYQLKTSNASHVDVAWAYSIGLVSVFYFWLLESRASTVLLVLICVLVWSMRLGTFLLLRLRGKVEDSRYRDLRASWSQTKFFIFYQFQALAVVLFSLPVLASISSSGGSVLDVKYFIGISIALMALIGEAVADRQLERFKKDASQRGKTCRYGLWKYSRHPNYFFEWLFWFSFVAFAWGNPWGFLAWLGPIVMLVLLFGVTGIPPSEARALKSRGEDYRRYQATTSVFIPWFPKS